VLKPNKDPMLTKIIMTGIENEITLLDVDNAIRLNEREIKELETNIKIQELKLKNVDENYPDVKDIPELTRKACYLYTECFAFLKVANQKLKELKKANKDMKEQLIEIRNQTGLCQK
jgi:hypothetical protein